MPFARQVLDMASSIRTASPEEAERLPNHKLFSRQRMDPLMFFVRLFEWRVVVGASLVVGCLLPWYATMAAAAALLVAPLLRVGLKVRHSKCMYCIHTSQCSPDGLLFETESYGCNTAVVWSWGVFIRCCRSPSLIVCDACAHDACTLADAFQCQASLQNTPA